MKNILETERLLLRQFTEEDAQHLLRMESDPEVLRYVGRKALPDADAYRRHIHTSFLPYYDRPEDYGVWAIVEKLSGEFVGGCGLKPALEASDAAAMGYGLDEVALGYGFRQVSWGRGYATELARALVRKAFTGLGAAAVVASVAMPNGASIRVLEKAGLRRAQGLWHVPGEDHASLKYVLTRAQFVP